MRQRGIMPNSPLLLSATDWSRLTAETSMWTHVFIDDYWGLWSWATVGDFLALGHADTRQEW
jgi:hypothetical protein